MDETNPSFLGLYFHRVVVSRWFPVVDDVQGLGLEGKVKMINGVHGYSVVGKEIHSDEQGHPSGQLRADVLMEELLLHKMTQGIPHLIPVLRDLGLMSRVRWSVLGSVTRKIVDCNQNSIELQSSVPRLHHPTDQGQ